MAWPQGKTTASAGEISVSRQTGHSTGKAEAEFDLSAADNGERAAEAAALAVSDSSNALSGLLEEGAAGFAAASALASASDFTGRGTNAMEEARRPPLRLFPLPL